VEVHEFFSFAAGEAWKNPMKVTLQARSNCLAIEALARGL
jgi:hypothetical protein